MASIITGNNVPFVSIRDCKILRKTCFSWQLLDTDSNVLYKSKTTTRQEIPMEQLTLSTSNKQFSWIILLQVWLLYCSNGVSPTLRHSHLLGCEQGGCSNVIQSVDSVANVTNLRIEGKSLPEQIKFHIHEYTLRWWISQRSIANVQNYNFLWECDIQRSLITFESIYDRQMWNDTLTDITVLTGLSGQKGGLVRTKNITFLRMPCFFGFKETLKIKQYF
jgi:hypothetical protein